SLGSCRPDILRSHPRVLKTLNSQRSLAMAKDPGLSADTCLFMESTSGDGGVHNANVWWLSPDIVLTGPVSGADKADPGQINSVDITIRRKSAESNCAFPGDEQL